MNTPLRIPDAAPRTRYKHPLRGPRFRPQRYVVRSIDALGASGRNTVKSPVQKSGGDVMGSAFIGGTPSARNWLSTTD